MATKPSVYIETTIVSYLTARPSRDLVLAAHQQITQEWWEQHRSRFDLYISQLVLDESAQGNKDAAQRRYAAIRQFALLPLTEAAIALAERFVTTDLLDAKAGADALHLSVATVHRMNFLVTWNCRHLANAQILTEIGRFLRTIGHELPFVCTPEELMGGE